MSVFDVKALTSNVNEVLLVGFVGEDLNNKLELLSEFGDVAVTRALIKRKLRSQVVQLLLDFRTVDLKS